MLNRKEINSYSAQFQLRWLPENQLVIVRIFTMVHRKFVEIQKQWQSKVDCVLLNNHQSEYKNIASIQNAKSRIFRMKNYSSLTSDVSWEASSTNGNRKKYVARQMQSDRREKNRRLTQLCKMILLFLYFQITRTIGIENVLLSTRQQIPTMLGSAITRHHRHKTRE